MKKIIILSLLMLTPFLSQAQIDLGLSYDFAKPTSLMGLNIDRSHGFSISGLYRIPKTRLSVGLDLGIAMYGFEKKSDLYMMEDGNSFNVDVEVENCYAITNAVLRYDLLASPKFINPYLTLSAGLSYFWTDLIVEDPNVSHGFGECPEPLEEDVLLKDYTFNASVGVGAQADMSKIFKSLPENMLLFDVQAQYVQGGQVNYMSIDAAPPSRNSNSTRAEEINVDYVDQADPDIVHRYHLGYSYTTPLQMMRFRFGMVFRWE